MTSHRFLPSPRTAVVAFAILAVAVPLTVRHSLPTRAAPSITPVPTRCSGNGPVARVQFVKGKLQQRHGHGSWHKIGHGALIYKGAEVRSESSSKAVLNLCGTGALYVNSKSDVLMTSRSRVTLQKGEIAEVTKSPSKHQLRTSVATVRGERVDLKLSHSKTYVTSIAGSVTVKSDHGSVTLKSTERTTIRRGHKPSVPTRVNVKQLLRWLESLPSLGGPVVPPPKVTPTSPPSTGPTPTPGVPATPGGTPSPTPIVSGRSLYVSPNGNDGASCSQQAPCASIQAAASLAQPGDAVVIEQGSYPPQLVQNVKGTQAAPITIKGQGTVTLTRPKPADTVMQQTALLHLLNDQYVTIQGLTILGMKGRSDYDASSMPCNPQSRDGTGGEVCIENHGNKGYGIVFQNNTVAHANNNCVKAQNEEENGSFLNNTLYDCGAPASANYDHGIYVSGPNNVIDGNTIHDITGDAIEVNGKGTTGNAITDNVIYNSSHAGIMDTASFSGATTVISGNVVHDTVNAATVTTNMRIDHNVFYDNTTAGIILNWSNPSWRSIGPVWIVNNTMYHNTAEIFNSASPEAGDSLTVRNNIFDDSGIPNAQLYHGSNAPTMDFDYNLYNGVTPPPGSGNAHSIVGNPQFVSPGSNFHVLSTSPAAQSAAGPSPAASVPVSPYIGAYPPQ